jgi:hypothetical protein
VNITPPFFNGGQAPERFISDAATIKMRVTEEEV